MKRKIIALCMVVAMLAVAIVGSTMAYFTDTDQAVNVMTIGNVKIEQIEQERDANGELAPFTQMKELLPAVYTTFDWAAPSEWPVPNDAAWKTFSPDIKNTIDKFITVKNTGKSDAFVRTIVAVEGDAINGSLIGVAINAHTASVPEVADEFQIVNFIEEVMINGVRYDVYEFVYKYALASGETTIPSFKQIYLSREATQDDVAVFGETFDVLAISQAIQANGFTDAVTALNEGFGEVTKAKVQEWFGALEVPSIVSTGDELRTALAAGESVVLDKDLTLDADDTITVAAGKSATIDLNGKTITSVSKESDSNRNAFDVSGELTVKNGTVTIEHTGANMGWNSSTNVFNVTAGGVLNIEDATVKNLGGSDMAFCVHLNNWGEVTLNANNVVFDSKYIAVRVFNSGYDMNNVTIKNSQLNGKYGFWVHNYTAADFGTQEKADAQAKLLNLDIFNGTNTFNTTSAPAILGFTDTVYLDVNGNVK